MEMFWIAVQIIFGLVTVIIPILMLTFWGLRNYPLMSSMIVGVLSFATIIYPVLFIYQGGHQITLSIVSAVLTIIGTAVVFKIYKIVTNDVSKDKSQFVNAS